MEIMNTLYDSDTLTYPLAKLDKRVVAIIVDTIIIGIASGPIIAILRGGGSSWLALAVNLVYCWYFWTRHDGQTPGKMLMGIRVIKTNGQPLRDVDALVRWAGYYINNIVLLLGWLWAFWDDKHQGWHDKLANTVVVDTHERVKIKNDLDEKPKRDFV
jgi:uncharacterized RDD family membrane protein YckC